MTNTSKIWGDSLEVEIVLPVSPSKLYSDWLDSAAHSAFTGGGAEASTKLGDSYTAWDGYISGKNIELEQGKKIVQSWRTTDFAENAADSILEIFFSPSPDKKSCTIKIKQSGLPAGSSQEYEKGWQDYYFAPMLAYYTKEHR